MKNDTALRRRLFVPEAFAHPAKGHIGLWQEIIERYTKEGNLILDPMSGIGTTLVAALMGRNVICVELEQHFVEPMKASWEKMRQHPMLGYEIGKVLILRGDAKALPLNRADCVVSSPPYEGSLTEGQDGIDDTKWTNKSVTSKASARSIVHGYTRPVDAVVSSPPYGGAEKRDKSPYQDGRVAVMMSRSYRSGVYSTENIGNQKGDAYWSEMEKVYSEAWRVLKPGGIMALVLGNFVRDGKIIDLIGQTVILCEQLGFERFDQWQRKKWALNFWRILQARKGGPVIDSEDIVAFRKPYPGTGSEDSLMARDISPSE